MSTEAMKLALEALKTVYWHSGGSCWVADGEKLQAAEKACEAALGKQEQEGSVCARCGGIVSDPAIKQERQVGMSPAFAQPYGNTQEPKLRGETKALWGGPIGLNFKPEQGEPVVCGGCNGSGRMIRDPDIGTDQDCFVCEGSGVCKDTTPQQHKPLTADDMKEPKNGTEWRVEWWNESCRMMLPLNKRLDCFQSYKNGTLQFTIKEAAHGIKEQA